MSNSDMFEIVHQFPEANTEALWQDLLANSDAPTHYTSPAYFRDPFVRGKQAFAVMGLSDGRIDGVLTGIHDGNHLVSGLSVRPQISFRNGIDQNSVARKLLQGALYEGRKRGLITIFTWSRLPNLAREGFRVRPEDGVVMLDLSRDLSALRKEMSGFRLVKQAINAGVEVRQAAGEDDYRDFYTIYVAWCTKKKTAMSTFEVWREGFSLRENRRLFLATLSGKIIAGSVVRFVPGGIVEYAANSSLDEFRNARPNDLLMWRIIEWARAEGFIKYSLGGCHQFLRKFGPEIVPIYRYRLDRTLLRHHDVKEYVDYRARRIIRVVRNKFKAIK